MTRDDFIKEFKDALEDAEERKANKFDFYFVGHGH